MLRCHCCFAAAIVSPEENALARAAFALLNVAAGNDAEGRHETGHGGQDGGASAAAADEMELTVAVEQLNQVGAGETVGDEDSQGTAGQVRADEHAAVATEPSTTDRSAFAATPSDSTAGETVPTTSRTAATVSVQSSGRPVRITTPSVLIQEILNEAAELDAEIEAMLAETLGTSIKCAR